MQKCIYLTFQGKKSKTTKIQLHWKKKDSSDLNIHFFFSDPDSYSYFLKNKEIFENILLKNNVKYKDYLLYYSEDLEQKVWIS